MATTGPPTDHLVAKAPRNAACQRLPSRDEIKENLKRWESGDPGQTDLSVGLLVGEGRSTPAQLWMLGWTEAAELLLEIGRLNGVGDDDERVQWLGQRLGFLEPYEMDEPEEARGWKIRKAIREAVTQHGADATRQLNRKGLDRLDHGNVALAIWHLVVHNEGDAAKTPTHTRNALGQLLLGKTPTGEDARSVDKLIDNCWWRAGLYRPATVYVKALAALEGLYQAVLDALEPIRAYKDPRTDHADYVGLEQSLRRVMSTSTVNVALLDGKPWCDTALLPVQQQFIKADGLYHLREGSANKLVAGPAGSGKSLLGRLAASAVLHRPGSNVVVCVPTRALVTQAARDYRRWLTMAGFTGMVLEASRDYHRNDFALQKGDFHAAIVVYEKLLAFLGIGSSILDSCGLLIVDEAHNLSELGRGPKLESLLSLVRLRRPHLPLMLISAAFDTSKIAPLSEWLDVDPEADAVTAKQRPTDITLHVADGRKQTTWLDPTSVSATGVEQPEEHPGPKWQAISSEREGALSGGHRKHHRGRTNYKYTGLCVDEQLRDDSEKLILVFVRSRQEATDLATHLTPIVKEALQKRPPHGLPALLADDGKNPWLFGRLAPDVIEDETLERARGKFRRLRAEPQWAGARSTLGWLRSGVGVHRAGLTSALRAIIESEFVTGGLLRVLVSTDSLAEGVNLPADVVILTHLTQAIGPGSYRVISPANFKNKVGRAARLGVGRATALDHPVGDAWVLTDDIRSSEVKYGNYANIASRDKIWGHFVAPPPDTAQLSSVMEPEDIAGVALTHLAHTISGRGLEPEPLQDAIDNAVAHTLWHHSRDPTAPAPDIVALLNLRSLLDDGRVTRLGRAIARSSVGVANADLLAHLVAAADRSEEPHPLELFYRAALLPAVVDQMDYIAAPDARLVGDAEAARVSGSIAAWARRVLATHSDTYHVRLKPPIVLDADAAVDELLAHGTRLLEAAGADNAEVAAHTALLRAICAIRWSAGEPFEAMFATSKAAIPVDEDSGRQPLRYELGDVEQLMSLMAWGLRAAIPASNTNAGRLRLVDLSRAVAVGLPSWTAPLVRLEVPGLHREALSPFAALGLDDIMGIFDDAGFCAAIDADVRDAARSALERQQQYRRWFRRLPRHKAADAVQTVAYEEWRAELAEFAEEEQFTPEQAATFAAATVSAALADHGIPVQFEGEGSQRRCECVAGQLSVVIVADTLDQREALRLRDDPTVAVLALRDVTDGAAMIAETGAIHHADGFLEALHDARGPIVEPEGQRAPQTADEFADRLTTLLLEP